MPDQDPLEIPVPAGGKRMATVDLPEGVAGELLREGVATHQQMMLESKGNIQHSNNLARLSANKKFDEVGSIESRAVDMILAGGPNSKAAA